MAEEQYSFIETINAIREKLPAIQEASDLLDADNVAKLEELAAMDTTLLIDDLRRGNYLGNRKIDINLSLNMVGIENTTDEATAESIWTDGTKTVSYDSAKVTFVDGETVNISFLIDGNPVEISTHADLLIQLNNNAAFLAKAEQTLWKGITHNIVGEFVRFYDVIGQNSNIERIELNATTGSYKEQKPVYYWAKTTSAFQTLAMRAGEVIKLGNDIDSIISLANSIEQILELQSRIPEFVDTFTGEVPNGDVTIYNKLAELDALYQELTGLIAIYDDIKAGGSNYINTTGADLQLGENSEIKKVNLNKDDISTAAQNIQAIKDAPAAAQTATSKAGEAAQSAQTASQKADSITALNGEQTANTLQPGSSVTVYYSTVSGKFTFNIPKGDQGEKGEAFQVNAVGVLADRGLYDDRLRSFSYLATDVEVIENEGTPEEVTKIIPHIYFKLSDTDGDWSEGAPFGRGDTGPKGASVADTVFVGTTDPSGEAGKSGAVDTYKFLYDDGSFSDTFPIYNGQDSAVLSVAGKTGDVVLSKSDVGLSEVDNTSDENKPISIAAQNLFNQKADKLNYLSKTANYTAAANDYITLNSSGGTFTITLPETHTINDVIYIQSGSSAETNAITVSGNGSNILLLNETDTNLVIDKNGIELKFLSDGTNWRVL